MSHYKHGRGGCDESCCLEIKNLCVSFREQEILKNVSFHLHCGELTALIGPNGAGKTTLLRCILGQQDYQGSIGFSCYSRCDLGHSHHQPQIGYVPQSPVFDRTNPVSVQDLFLMCTKRPAFLPPSKETRRRISDCLDRVHACHLIDRGIGTLSGGELQRVLLSLALEPVPQILILDEPLSGVDIEGMAVLMDMLSELLRLYDLSVLITTHDFSILEKYADKVLLLDGAQLYCGAPCQVLESDAFRRAFKLGGDPQC